MANLGKIVYLSAEQKDTLFANGSVTVDGTTITYSANDLYLTPETLVELPSVSSSDNDKVLKVVSGAWAAATDSSSDIILVQNAQPQSTNNKIWIKETSTSVSIPEMSDIADFVSFTEDQTSRTDAEKAQVRSNIGAGKEWTKVWENASPSSDFAEQDVSVNLSDYTEIMIYWRQIKTENCYFMQTYLIVASTSSFLFNNSAGKNIRRVIAFASDLSKITFKVGQSYQSYGTATTSNGHAIPIKIYAR